MKNKHILFVNPGKDRSLEKVVHRALVSSGSRISMSNDAADLQRILDSDPADLVLVNYDNADEPTKEFVKQIFTQSHNIPAVLLSQKRDKAHLINLFAHDRMRNLIARNDQVNESELIITTEKLLRQDIFGLDKYMTWGVDFVNELVTDSSKKSEHIEHVSEFVRGLKCDDRFVHLAEVITDELLMNALYDAPIDENGKPRYAHLPRTERVQLSKADYGELTFGSDGRYLAIACRDRFGALKAKTVVQYLRKCFAQDEYQVDTKAGGAGVGFYMIFQSVSQLVVNIEPGKMTETLGLIDIRATYRDTKAQSKSFNIFLKEGST